MTPEEADIAQKFQALPPEKRLSFTLWVVSQIESHELEGQYETAQTLRRLMGLLSRAHERVYSPSDLTNTPRP